MPSYRYLSSDETGKKYKGTLTAADEADLQQRLKTDGQYLLKSSTGRVKAGKPLKSSVLADFSRQIGSLVGAGVSLVRALAIIAEEEDLKPRIRAIYTELNRSVRRGVPLSQAMEEQGDTFPPLMIYMFRSSEASGSLETTAMKMAEHYEKDTKMTSKVKSAMVYPRILAVLIIGAVAIIMGYVMPQFKELFAQMPQLPLSTRILFAISNFFKNDWWIFIPCVIIFVILVKAVCRLPKVRLFLDELKLRLPRIGKLLQIIYTARFARTLSSLYACGISIVNALQISRRVIGNTFVEAQFDALIAFVRSGHPLSEGLRNVDGFSKKLSSTVRVGEESGSLEDLLTNIADTFDYDAEASLNKLVAMVEPAMIVIMAVIVAFIIYAVITPIYGSYSAIG